MAGCENLKRDMDLAFFEGVLWGDHREQETNESYVFTMRQSIPAFPLRLPENGRRRGRIPPRQDHLCRGGFPMSNFIAFRPVDRQDAEADA